MHAIVGFCTGKKIGDIRVSQQLTLANVRGRQRQRIVLVEKGLALLAVLALRVVRTVVTNTAGHAAAGLEYGSIEVAARGVVVAFAL